jgi:RecB family endonuclease NucS
MTPVTPEQSAEIHRLHGEGVSREEIARQLGVTPGQVASVLAWIKIRERQPGRDPETEDAIETTFGLERDLQEWLRRNIADLEPGLSISDGGREQKVAAGFIDITGRDCNGAAVVLELKAGAADRDAVGQILAYMGDLMATEKSVRGILVAGDFSPRAIAAARAARNVKLIRYGIRFSFAPVSVDPVSGC